MKPNLRPHEIAKRYDEIEGKINYVVSHGKTHIKHVQKLARQISKACNFSKQELRLLDIAALLHDVGRGIEPENHAEAGAKFAKKYLSGILSQPDIETVYSAIYYHDSALDDPNKDKIGLALKLADKLDIVNSRLRKGFEITAKQALYTQIKRVQVSAKNGQLTLTFTSHNLDKTLFEKYTQKLTPLIDNLTSQLNMSYVIQFKNK